MTERLAALFRWSLDRHAAAEGVWGISLSVPGTVQGGAEGAFMTATPSIMPAWDGYPLVETLTQSFGVPVWIRSSVETMTLHWVTDNRAIDAICYDDELLRLWDAPVHTAALRWGR